MASQLPESLLKATDVVQSQIEQAKIQQQFEQDVQTAMLNARSGMAKTQATVADTQRQAQEKLQQDRQAQQEKDSKAKPQSQFDDWREFQNRGGTSDMSTTPTKFPQPGSPEGAVGGQGGELPGVPGAPPFLVSQQSEVGPQRWGRHFTAPGRTTRTTIEPNAIRAGEVARLQQQRAYNQAALNQRASEFRQEHKLKRDELEFNKEVTRQEAARTDSARKAKIITGLLPEFPDDPGKAIRAGGYLAAGKVEAAEEELKGTKLKSGELVELQIKEQKELIESRKLDNIVKRGRLGEINSRNTPYASVFGSAARSPRYMDDAQRGVWERNVETRERAVIDGDGRIREGQGHVLVAIAEDRIHEGKVMVARGGSWRKEPTLDYIPADKYLIIAGLAEYDRFDIADDPDFDDDDRAMLPDLQAQAIKLMEGWGHYEDRKPRESGNFANPARWYRNGLRGAASSGFLIDEMKKKFREIKEMDPEQQGLAWDMLLER